MGSLRSVQGCTYNSSETTSCKALHVTRAFSVLALPSCLPVVFCVQNMTPGQAQACRATTASTTTALALSLLLPLSTLRGCSSFLLPAPFVGRSPPSCKTWASSPSTAGTPDTKESFPTHSGDVKPHEDSKDGQPESPAGLTLEGVYRRLKLDTQGLDDGIVGLESKDTDYGVRVTAVLGGDMPLQQQTCCLLCV